MIKSAADFIMGVWTTPEVPLLIEYPLDIMEELRALLSDELQRLSRGGSDVAGILFGVSRGAAIRIMTWRGISRSTPEQPSQRMSRHDRAEMVRVLGMAASDPAMQGYEPLGWFISHAEGGTGLTPADIDLFENFFPNSWQVTLLLRRGPGGTARAGFFVREPDGSLRPDASYRELFIQPVRRVPGAPAPKPALSAVPPPIESAPKENHFRDTPWPLTEKTSPPPRPVAATAPPVAETARVVAETPAPIETPPLVAEKPIPKAPVAEPRVAEPPVTATTPPVVETSPPSPPIFETPRPVAEVPPPIVETPRPVAEVPRPVAPTPPPPPEAPRPMVEAHPPIAKIPRPTREIPPLVAEPPQPIAEPLQPIARSKEPSVQPTPPSAAPAQESRPERVYFASPPEAAGPYSNLHYDMPAAHSASEGIQTEAELAAERIDFGRRQEKINHFRDLPAAPPPPRDPQQRAVPPTRISNQLSMDEPARTGRRAPLLEKAPSPRTPWAEPPRTEAPAAETPSFTLQSHSFGGAKWLWVGLGLLAVALVIFLITQRTAATPGTATFALRVASLGDRIEISWDRDSTPVWNGQRASIKIQDGSDTKQVSLSAEQLRGGKTSYARETPDVAIEMTIYDTGAREYHEFARFIAPPLAAPAAAAPAQSRDSNDLRAERDNLAAEVTRLKESVRKEAARADQAEDLVRILENRLRIDDSRSRSSSQK